MSEPRRHICDCGQIYHNLDALIACQNARHSAAAGCELADAEAFARQWGSDQDYGETADDADWQGDAHE